MDIYGTGNPKDIVRVEVPLPYLKPTSHDSLDWIYQGGYKVYDIQTEKSKVSIIGPLNPCTGAAITDGKKLILFHIHLANSLTHMQDLIKKHLDFSKPEKVLARLISAKDEFSWAQEERFRDCQTAEEFERKMKEGKVADAKFKQNFVVKTIKDALEAINIPRSQCQATLIPIRKEDGSWVFNNLNLFSSALTHVAVRLDTLFEPYDIHEHQYPQKIKFWSISPASENFYKVDTKNKSLENIIEKNLEISDVFCNIYVNLYWKNNIKEKDGQGIMSTQYNTIDFFPIGEPTSLLKKEILFNQLKGIN